MVTPDGTNIGSPSKKVEGFSSDDQSDRTRNLPPPRPVNKEFKEVLEEGESVKAAKKQAGKKVAVNLETDVVEEEVVVADEGVTNEPFSFLTPLKKSDKIKDKIDAKEDAPSPFDLAKTASVGKDEVDIDIDVDEEKSIVGWPAGTSEKTETKGVIEENVEKQSPFRVFKETRGTRDTVHESHDVISPTSSKKEKVDTRFAVDQPDISQVNPFIGTPGMGAEIHGVDVSTPRVDRAAIIAHIKALADKVVDSIYTLEQSGKTETTVTIKNMPFFNDARIVLTSFNTAPKEFNIAFENLRPDAKVLIDQNIGTLKLALDDKGFVNVVHILSTTTLIEHPLPTDTRSGQRFARGEGGGAGGQPEERRDQQKK